jgi:hypothetical protein
MSERYIEDLIAERQAEYDALQQDAEKTIGMAEKKRRLRRMKDLEDELEDLNRKLASGAYVRKK